MTTGTSASDCDRGANRDDGWVNQGAGIEGANRDDGWVNQGAGIEGANQDDGWVNQGAGIEGVNRDDGWANQDGECQQQRLVVAAASPRGAAAVALCRARRQKPEIGSAAATKAEWPLHHGPC